jgi:TetR/AcrR family transcriptional regulator, transcriptional repressor of bet genes
MSAPSDRLVATVIELLMADGFEGVSVRRVATAAGVSIGAVQHHFPTKAAMLDAAMEQISEAFTGRLTEQLTADDDPERLLRVAAEELLGIGEERRAAGVIWLQRLARAAVDPDVARGHAADWLRVEDLISRLLSQCRADLDREWCRDRAAGLVALLDGLAAAVLTEPARMPPERARRILDAELDGVLAGD